MQKKKFESDQSAVKVVKEQKPFKWAQADTWKYK